MQPPITITSPLPDQDLLFAAMTDTQGLSTLGEMQLSLLSPRPDLDPDALLGKPVTIKLQLRNQGVRCFNGYITRFGIGVHQGRHFAYQATVSPWLWFLTRNSDCRIFQDLTVPEIVQRVFDGHAMAQAEFKLFRHYRKWVYCVQYRESDFNFVARLLEHEGIYWYFAHSDGQHKLVLVDANSAHDAAPGCDSLPFIEHGATHAPDTDCVWHWQASRQVCSSKVALNSFDFERPSADLQVSAGRSAAHSPGRDEVFDWQGDYAQRVDAAQWAEDRVDELLTTSQQLQGKSNAPGLAVGHVLALKRHPRADQNTQYLITLQQLQAQVSGHEAGHPVGQMVSEFSATPLATQFRPARRTRKPVVQGPQTAVVVGPAGEEIYTDAYGRVKLQFHWDRYGRRNEGSSCWVRVSSPWAGQSFGAIQLPRIGQEVVVDFLEGDPDQPLITGRVYNAEQMPPWGLPANATQSGVLTRSSKGGAAANANVMRFEDKKGEEQLWLHAEKDQLTEVEHDEDKWVGNDRRKTIDRDETTRIKRDRTETVDRNEKITVHGWRTEEVDGDETITVHSNRKERVDHNEKISIGDNRAEDVGHDETVSIGHDQTLSVGDNRSRSVGQSETIRIGKNQSLKIGGNRSKTVARNETAQIGMLSMLTVGMARMLNVGMVYSQNIGMAMTTLVGKSQTTKVGTSQSTTVGEDYSLAVGDEGASTVKINGQSIRLDATKIHLNGKDEILLTCGGSTVRLTPTKIEVLGGAVKLNC